MKLDPDNKIIKLCSEGMNFEGQGKHNEAYQLFLRAWQQATDNFEKFISAHYIARHQKNVADKLKWDRKALALALKITKEDIRETYPSLYLNIAKCYEELKDFGFAKKNYESALSFINYLPGDGYGKMIKSGIMDGLKRVSNNC